uniref:Uncharacterized protein n=1 Tax=Arundo donax TaxID=35708 RepID=A0A0A9CD14_ARUDO
MGVVSFLYTLFLVAQLCLCFLFLKCPKVFLRS